MGGCVVDTAIRWDPPPGEEAKKKRKKTAISKRLRIAYCIVWVQSSLRNTHKCCCRLYQHAQHHGAYQQLAAQQTHPSFCPEPTRVARGASTNITPNIRRESRWCATHMASQDGRERLSVLLNQEKEHLSQNKLNGTHRRTVAWIQHRAL